MKEKISSMIGYLVCICAILTVLLTCIQVQVLDVSFYETQYEKLGTASSMHMSQEDLLRSTTTLLDYIENKKDSIEVSVVRNGIEQEMFNEKEAKHMVDVKHLYQVAMLVRNLSLCIVVAGLCYMQVIKKKQQLSFFAWRYQKTAMGFTIVVTFLMIAILTDFNLFWTMFHKLVFTNDLWLLDPRVDQMINLFPEPFFFAMVTNIALKFLFFFVLGLLLSYWKIKKDMKQLNMEDTICEKSF